MKLLRAQITNNLFELFRTIDIFCCLCVTADGIVVHGESLIVVLVDTLILNDLMLTMVYTLNRDYYWIRAFVKIRVI